MDRGVGCGISGRVIRLFRCSLGRRIGLAAQQRRSAPRARRDRDGLVVLSSWRLADAAEERGEQCQAYPLGEPTARRRRLLGSPLSVGLGRLPTVIAIAARAARALGIAIEGEGAAERARLLHGREGTL